MTKKTIRRTVSFISTGFLILFLFTGSYHSFCECYAQTCPIHSHAKPFIINVWILQTSSAVADLDQPHVTPFRCLFEDAIALSTRLLTPLKTRAPPHEAFPQIIASRYQG
jgi:hypothetical protein